MFTIVQTLCLYCAFSCIESLEVIPERPIIDYNVTNIFGIDVINSKYIRSMNLTIRRRSRRSPHYIKFAVDTRVGVGNNMTVAMVMFEALTAGYHPTPLQAKYRFCDFLYKEPFLGQMYAKQLPANWSCPFPANFPFNIPFTSPSMIINTRADVQGYVTDTNELVFKFKVYVTITQKPKNILGSSLI